MATTLQKLYDEQRQSPWIDFITRDLIQSGELKTMIDKGIRGLTSNPTIFEKAISGSADYDEAFREQVQQGAGQSELYEALIVEDIRNAADVLRPLYDASDGGDGYVSIEVNPKLAYDTEGTVEEARKFFKSIDRPNIFVKVPATNEGVVAVRRLLAEGININITLIFSIVYHEQVMDAYIEAVEERVANGQPVDRLASVASFFVSRVDTEVDKRLGKLIEDEQDEERRKDMEGLLGKAAVANAKLAYELFQSKFTDERFLKLAEKGAQVQRPLWGSTSSKNPAYKDVIYIEELIGPDTVNTIPPQTIEVFLDHGVVARTVDQDLDAAREVMQKLEAYGISLEDVTNKLQADGVKSFSDSFDALDQVIQEKRDIMLAEMGDRQSAEIGEYQGKVESRLTQLQEAGFAGKLWNLDDSLWQDDPSVREKIANRLGWLPVVEEMTKQVPELQAFADELKQDGFKFAVVLGMGGSSLAPDVLRHTFGSAQGYPELRVLDTTDSAAIHAVEREVDLEHTLFIVSSKSGTTVEPNSLYAYFWDRVASVRGERVGESFIAITDPGTKMANEAYSKNFRRVFENRADIGGRYSALSYFGLVPAAIIGVDLEALLGRAQEAARACGPDAPAADNPGLWLGAVIGELAQAGRNKLTLIASPGIGTYGYWVEQLIAESTGKEGAGVLPVEGEALGGPEVYGDDRLFVHLSLGSSDDQKIAVKLDALVAAGHPVVRLKLAGPLDLGGEFLRWEIATAVAGAVLGINPFDEPNVQESKDNTMRLLETYQREGALPEPEPTLSDGELSLYGVQGANLSDALASVLSRADEGDYVAFMIYTQMTPEVDEAMQDVRIQARDALRTATTLGYGPRFLHSTGQFHKGGPQVGVFVQVTADDALDLEIPGSPYTFNTLKRAQALGDFEALAGRGLPSVRVHVRGDLVSGLLTLRLLVQDAVSATR